MLGPKTIRHTIYNGDRSIGPVLLATDSESVTPIVTGENRIFQSGTGQMLDAALGVIKGSREMLCISSFMIQDSEIITEVEAAADRGVRVYILTAPEHQVSSKYEDDDSDIAERDRAAISLLRRLGHKALIKTAEHLHSKFLLSDPKSNPKGAVFTNNLTVRAINENLELTVMLEPEAVRELFHQFLLGFWEEAEREVWLQGSESRLRTENKHPEFVHPDFSPSRLRWTTRESTSLSDQLLSLVESAEKTISVSAWTFSEESKVTQGILKRAKEGIRVRVFTRQHKNNAAFIKDAIDGGGDVFCHRLMHAKSIVVDETRGVIMTANFSPLGLDNGYETGVLLSSEQVKTLEQIHQEWVTRAQYRSMKNVAFGKIKGEYLDPFSGMTVHEPPARELEVQFGNLEALSMTDYRDIKYSFRPEQGKRNAVSEIHVYKLLPPLLPNGSKKTGMIDDERFELYENRGNKYLCVENETDIDTAIQLETDLGVKAVSKR